MEAHRLQSGPFDIPDLPDFIPRRLKPWLFVFFVLIIQFSGGIYPAAASHMVGATALMQEDILMAGYASLVGMSINFAVMFRLKFRFSNRTALLVCCAALLLANLICAHTDSAPLLAAACFAAGWFRMWATFACNSTIQLWLTPVRDMSVFFCFVYLLVDGVMQLSGLATVYTAFFLEWRYMHWFMCGLLVLLMLLVCLLLKPVKGPIRIPLRGIDWIGAALWSVFMLCFTFVCVYGDFYDWWDAAEIRGATLLGIAVLCINLWRAAFLHHPYISFAAMTNRNVIRASAVYLVFFTLLATEHVFEHGYAARILGFDDTNAVDLNLYVLAGVLFGTGLTFLTFARRKWRYKTMTVIAFALGACYLGYFYLRIDYGLEKEALFLPLFFRGAASVVVSIAFLTSIVQSGLPFSVFPQALTINGFTGAVAGAAFGPALIGELLRRTAAKNAAQLAAALTDVDTQAVRLPLARLYETVQTQAFAVSLKEIYGWLFILSLAAVSVVLISYGPVRPTAFFPKWKTIRRIFRQAVRTQTAS